MEYLVCLKKGKKGKKEGTKEGRNEGRNEERRQSQMINNNSRTKEFNSHLIINCSLIKARYL